jgi:hypothetical protein
MYACVSLLHYRCSTRQFTCFTGTEVQILTQKALLSVDINSRVYNRMRVHTGQVEIPTFTQLYVYQHLLNLVLSE